MESLLSLLVTVTGWGGPPKYYHSMNDSLNSRYPINNPYNTPVYNPPVRTLDYSSYGGIFSIILPFGIGKVCYKDNHGLPDYPYAIPPRFTHNK